MIEVVSLDEWFPPELLRGPIRDIVKLPDQRIFDSVEQLKSRLPRQVSQLGDSIAVFYPYSLDEIPPPVRSAFERSRKKILILVICASPDMSSYSLRKAISESYQVSRSGSKTGIVNSIVDAIIKRAEDLGLEINRPAFQSLIDKGHLMRSLQVFRWVRMAANEKKISLDVDVDTLSQYVEGLESGRSIL